MKHHRTSLLIVDDHEVVRNGIRSYLEKISDFHVVGEASSGEEALSMVAEMIPDIVLLDLIMPGMDGIETTRRIRQISPRTKVVVLTSYHEDAHIFPALKAGDMQGIVVQNPMKMGYLGVKTLVAHHPGQPVEPDIDTGCELVTPGNMDAPAVADLLRPPLEKYLK